MGKTIRILYSYGLYSAVLPSGERFASPSWQYVANQLWIWGFGFSLRDVVESGASGLESREVGS